METVGRSNKYLKPLNPEERTTPDPYKPKEVPESTFQDYMQTVSSFGIQGYNEELRYKPYKHGREGFDPQDPEFVAVFDKQDIETQKEMLAASSTSQGIMIAERRNVFRDSAEAISNDGLPTQLAMGLIPAIANPTSLIPIGAVYSGAMKLGMTASRLTNMGIGLGVGAVTGAAINMTDEYFMEKQGIQHDYLSAGVMGALMLGGIGTLSGLMYKPRSIQSAESMSRETDTLTKDFEQDPIFKITNDEDGVPMLDVVVEPGAIGKSLTDYIPLIGNLLKSDVTIAAQSKSQVIRSMLYKFANPTVALKDVDGNIIKSSTNASDFATEIDGILHIANKDLQEIYYSNKMPENYDDFISNISKVYTKAATEQEVKLYKEIETAKDIVRREFAKKKKEQMKQTTSQLSPEELKMYKKEVDKLAEDLDVEYRAKIDEEIFRIKEEIYSKDTTKFKGNAAEVAGAERMRAYFQTMLKSGQDVGMKELAGINLGRIYRPRMWDFKRIKDKPAAEVKAQLRSGIENHPAQSSLTAKQVDEVTEGLYAEMMKGALDLDMLTSSWTVPKKLPFAKLLVSRKIRINEEMVGDLINTNLGDAGGAYHYKMRGRQALTKYMGTDDVNEFTMAMQEALIKEGNIHTPQEMKSFGGVLEDIAGTLRMNSLSNTPAWTFARQASTYNTLRLGGRFGANQAIELVGNIMWLGISNVFNGRFKATLKNSGKLMYTHGKVDDEVTNAIIASGFMESALRPHKVNRLADGEAGFNSGILEAKANNLADSAMKWNGMRYLMGVMEDMTGGAVLSAIQTLSKKKKWSTAEEKRMARWGLDRENIQQLSKDLDTYYKPKEGKLDLASFSKESRDLFQMAISKGIKDSIIKGDSIHAPNWHKTAGPLLKTITTFMRFPLIANEVLLRKGLSDEQAKFGAGIVGSVTMFLGMKYVREQAMIQAGLMHEIESKYDYFGTNGEEQLHTAMLESLNLVAQFGMLSGIYNAASPAFNLPNAGRSYVKRVSTDDYSGPVFGAVKDIMGLMQSASEGEVNTERNRLKLKSLAPFQNFPIIEEATRYLLKD